MTRPAPRHLALAIALLAVGGPACDGDGAAPTPCSTDAECDAGEVCEPSGDEGACSPATDRPAIDDVAVPAGPFWMGCDVGVEPDCEAAEGPRHQVEVPAFRIDRTEVTAEAFAAFLTRQGDDCGGEDCYDAVFGEPPVEASGDGAWAARAGLGQRPMAEVTWYGADAYCRWRGQALCAEAQWEKAARGGCELADGDCAAWAPRFPWGDDEASCAVAHMSAGEYGCGTDGPSDVGAYPAGASPYGALDLAGNVWEWVQDSWHEGYADAPTDGSAWQGGTSLRVVRGGGFKSAGFFLRTSHRWNGGAGDSVDQRGFRCCRAE